MDNFGLFLAAWILTSHALHNPGLLQASISRIPTGLWTGPFMINRTSLKFILVEKMEGQDCRSFSHMFWRAKRGETMWIGSAFLSNL